MTNENRPVNGTAGGTMGGIASLANVSLCMGSFTKAVNRADDLPGLLVFYGPSGYGKTTAATRAAVVLQAYYIQCRSSWTRKAFYQALLKTMGVTQGRTLAEMEEQAIQQLAKSRRPLIIDETDYLAAKGIVELVKDLYEGSGTAILLIGEEKLPASLARWEHLHNRVLEWIPAQPATLEDTRELAKLYCADVQVEADLVEHIHRASKGVTRRIRVNLERVQEMGRTLGYTSMSLEQWGNAPFYTGEAPTRRY